MVLCSIKLEGRGKEYNRSCKVVVPMCMYLMVCLLRSGVEKVDENCCQTVPTANELHSASTVEEIESVKKVKVPVIAPALYNLGKLSVVDVSDNY